MKCNKCGDELKEYVGLTTVDTYCANEDCGKEVSVAFPTGTNKIDFNIFGHGPVGHKDEELPKDVIDALNYALGNISIFTGADLEYLANLYGISRFSDEDEEDFIFRIRAILNP